MSRSASRAQQDAAARDDVHLLAAVEALGGQPVHALELHHVALVEVHLEVRDVEQLRAVEAEDLAGDGRGARAVAHHREQRLQEVGRHARVVVEQQHATRRRRRAPRGCRRCCRRRSRGSPAAPGCAATGSGRGCAPASRRASRCRRPAPSRPSRVACARLSRQSTVSAPPFQLSTTMVTSWPVMSAPPRACPGAGPPTPPVIAGPAARAAAGVRGRRPSGRARRRPPGP